MTDAAVRTRGDGGREIRERILTAATTLFYDNGINVTGVDLVAAQAHVSKRTLYKYFPSKTVLVQKYLERIRDGVAAPSDTRRVGPRDRLLALFTVPHRGDGRMRGCPFHNAAVEVAGSMPAAAQLVHHQKAEFLAAITDMCRELRASDPVMLGRQLALLYEGAAALSTSIDDVEPWACARATAETLMDRALTHSG
jgi:AcrR family transcriptional regulator